MLQKLLQRVKEIVTGTSPGILSRIPLANKKDTPQKDEKIYITEDEYNVIEEALSEATKALEKIKTLAVQYEALRTSLLIEAIGHDREAQNALKELKVFYNVPEEGPWSLQVPSADKPLAYFFYNKERDNG